MIGKCCEGLIGHLILPAISVSVPLLSLQVRAASRELRDDVSVSHMRDRVFLNSETPCDRTGTKTLRFIQNKTALPGTGY